MQTFSILTLFSALSAAAPHAINHFRFHERAAHVDALALKPSLVERDLEATNLVERQNKYNLLTGLCGGTSGYGCAPGFCCSQYGYCGQGPAYCGSGSSGSTSGGSSAAPAAPSPYNSPSAPSSSPSAQPDHPPSSPSGAPSAPSGAPSAPSSAPSSAPAPNPSPGSPSGGGGGFGNVYKMYSGDGSTSAGWPSQSDWMDFDSLWAANLPTIGSSCSEFQEKNNSPQESDELKSAIQSIGASSGVDPRVILAVVMQESKGCVRVDTTDNGVVNPGLMQSHDGSGTCNPGGPGAPGVDPCPSSEITQMIKDGTEGTSQGDGLKQTLSQCTGQDEAQRYYQAGTIYNSGNLPQNLDDNTATPCYASDIANRLTGWTTSETKCTLG